MWTLKETSILPTQSLPIPGLKSLHTGCSLRKMLINGPGWHLWEFGRLDQGSPTSRPQTSTSKSNQTSQISSSTRLEIKCMINVRHLNHPETTPPPHPQSMEKLPSMKSVTVPKRLRMTGLDYRYLQFSSVTQSYPTLCNPMNCSTPGLPVHHQLPEFTQTHIHWVGDAIQPSHPLSSPFPPAPNPSKHQGLFQWVNSSHEVAKVLEFQL